MSKQKKIEPKNKMFIFCEGDKTEPLYLSSYINEYAESQSKIIFIPPTRKNTPVQLVDEAIAKKKSKESLDGDVFWVVYDRESVSKYPRAKHAEAWDKAKKNGVNVAISNVCFEFWVLLHFEYTTQSYTSFKNLMSESNLKSHLRKVSINDYDKGSDELYFKIRKGIALARKRAKKVNEHIIESSEPGCQCFDYSPYTGVHELLDAIDQFTG